MLNGTPGHGSVEFVRAVYVFGDFSAFFAVFKYGVDSVGSVKVAMEFGFGKVMTKNVKKKEEKLENVGVVCGFWPVFALFLLFHIFFTFFCIFGYGPYWSKCQSC